MTNANYKGFTDSAATVDEFKITKYIDGLAEFIQECNTPMTMAVQGDWGSGKTSVMQMVRDKLPANNKTVWFNTWQYSQFNMGDELSVSFLGELIESLGVNNEELNTKFQTAIKTLKSVIRAGAIIALDTQVSGYLADKVADATADKSEKTTDISKIIKDLKEQFNSCVKSVIDNSGGAIDRIVIFVDDLDRLNPGKAVELLEVLKLFLDCDNCVFVLAIDYNVVVRGVRDKYGEDFSKEKGKSFFDKIIQVPFKMPVAEYDVSNYVKSCFESIGIKLEDQEQIDTYVNLIVHSNGTNPRSMKRLFNSFLLLSKVADKALLETDQNREMLFAMLCLQSSYDQVYSFIIKNRDTVDPDMLKALTIQSDSIFDDFDMSDDTRQIFCRFAKDLYDVIDKDHSDEIDEEEYEAFKKVLNYSTLTSSNTDSMPVDDLWGYRYSHKAKCREMIKKLNDKYGVKFKDYYRRTAEKGTWWLYIGGGRSPKNEDLRFGFECRLDPYSTNGKSSATVRIYTPNKAAVSEIISAIGDDPIKAFSGNKEIDEYGIRYRNVLIFNTGSDDDVLYETVDKCFAEVKEYFNE